MLFLIRNFEAQLTVRGRAVNAQRLFELKTASKKLISQVCLFQNDTGRAIRWRSLSKFRALVGFLTCEEKKHAIELLETNLSVTDRGVFPVQMDGNILTFWLAFKAIFTDMRPQILKLRQERFLTKGLFFARSPHQRIARIPRAPKARAKKNWRFYG